ncbi:MAG TPA: CoA pyrophosphatase [Candidatus Thermoplasmatota archaeon]|nr:CoA pyrophosphatase [Candidatus Thermoplasmatota archaeon]
MERSPTLKDVRRAFARRVAEPARDELPEGASAVLVPLSPASDGALSLVYTKRAETLRRHAGELSFPGGRVDADDAHPLAAALREAEEEIGLLPKDVEVLGHLTDMTTHYGVLVSAYVGVLQGPPPREPTSKEEVAEILTVPVAMLFDRARYEARAHVDMPDRRVHYWRLPRAVLWGITGELTARFLRRVWGWEPPGEPLLIDDVSAFRPTST